MGYCGRDRHWTPCVGVKPWRPDWLLGTNPAGGGENAQRGGIGTPALPLPVRESLTDAFCSWLTVRIAFDPAA